MAGSVNKVIIVGNLGADPEVKSFQNGGRICNLRIATSEDWKDKNHRREKRAHRVASPSCCNPTDWLALPNASCVKAAKSISKAACAPANGRTPSGNDRYSTEVSVAGFDGKLVMLDGAKGGSGGGGNDGWSGGVLWRRRTKWRRRSRRQ